MASAIKEKSKASARKPSSNGAKNLQILQGFRQALAAMLAEAEPAADDDLSRAQDLVYDAWDARTVKARLTLARKAIEVSPLCADAFLLLAEAEAPGSDAALALYRQAMTAGEAAIGPDDFRDCEGEFWGFLETRPYMRARLSLALCLHERGALEEAAEHMRAMLKLNPNDNQGVRYHLFSLLQHLKLEEELETLLTIYKESSAAWTYTAALAAFRREGETSASTRRLKAALKSNPHVPSFLLGTRKLPKTPPAFIGLGDVDEAVAYVQENQDAWAAARDWLRKHATPAKLTSRKA